MLHFKHHNVSYHYMGSSRTKNPCLLFIGYLDPGQFFQKSILALSRKLPLARRVVPKTINQRADVQMYTTGSYQTPNQTIQATGQRKGHEPNSPCTAIASFKRAQAGRQKLYRRSSPFGFQDYRVSNYWPSPSVSGM